MESSPTGIRNVKWGLIGALSIVFILTIASLSIAISVREGNLVDNSIGNNLIKNNQKFIFRGVTVEGDTTLGENNTDKITFNADVESNFVPNDDITFDLGSDSKRWRNIYADKLIGGVSVSAGVSSIGNASGGLSITPGSGTGAVDIGLSLGSGLAIVNQGLSVEIGQGLQFNGNAIEAIITDKGVSQITNGAGGLSIVADEANDTVDIGLSLGSGLAIVNQGLSVQLGNGLAFDGSGFIEATGTAGVNQLNNTDGSLSLSGSTGNITIGVSLSSVSGLSITSDGLSVEIGQGLQFNGNAIEAIITDKGVSQITNGAGGLSIVADEANDTVDIGLSLGSGLAIVNQGLSVEIGQGLQFNGNAIEAIITDKGVSQITNGAGGLSIVADEANDTVDIGLSLGSGLAIVNQGLSVQLGTGLAFDNNNIILQKPLGEAYIGSGDVVTVGSGEVIPFDTYGTNRNISTGISGFITDTAGYYIANAYFGASSATTIGSSLVLQRFDGGSATNIIIEQTYSAATARINGLVYANSGSCFNIINNGPADFIFSNVGTSTATKFEMIYMSN